MSGETLEADGVKLTFNAHCGFVSSLAVEDRGRSIGMMHRAPWIDSGETMPPDAAPHLARLSGDFFCAPFGDASADDAPIHGWPANFHWQHIDTQRDGARVTATYLLDRPAMGARLTKQLTLIDGHPFLYQLHLFEGGKGDIAVANHAMIDVSQGAVLSFSRRLWFETPRQGLETDPKRGRSKLKYPAMSEDLRHFPMADGSSANLTRYPFAELSEEFVIAVEAPGHALGWAAVARPRSRDLFLSLRNARELSMTMMWHSNGGRDYPPWSSRHIGVLGIEEGFCLPLCGYSASQAENPLRKAGVRTSLMLDPKGVSEVRHVTGCIGWAHDGDIETIDIVDGGLAIKGKDGAYGHLPCDTEFLKLSRLSGD
jgi:hypothetical protein